MDTGAPARGRKSKLTSNAAGLRLGARRQAPGVRRDRTRVRATRPARAEEP